MDLPPARTALPTPDPVPAPETERFWAALRDHVLLLQRCAACGEVIWYPRFFCPGCGSTSTSWFEASGNGTIYSFTVVRKSRREGYTTAVPYVVASVELDEGPRVFTNIVECDPDAVRIGQRVTLTFAATEGGYTLYRFRPAGSAAGQENAHKGGADV
jgi:uncharacterized OB-fold protein